MDLSEAEEILGCFNVLGATRHLIMINEPVSGEVDGVAFFRGLQPKHRRDTIVLTQQATLDTVPHELVHADLGLGELAAYPLGRVLVWKYRVLRNFPVVKSAVAPPVRYRRCPGCAEFPELHGKYAGRAEHYVKV